jgi:aspartate/methionine/tyrosine aminotransferase
MGSFRVHENVFLDELSDIVEEYVRHHRREPTDVSHWDPSPEFVQTVRATLPFPKTIDPIPYRYSYLVPTKLAVLTKLGLDPNEVGGLFTENGSASISAVANALKLVEVTDVHILDPSYFTTHYNLSRLGIDVHRVKLSRTDGRYDWLSDFPSTRFHAIWVTDPIYNTGVYHPDEFIHALVVQANAGTKIVVDETLSIVPGRFARGLGATGNFFGIYTPHKAICVNGMKFSFVAFRNELESSFEDWADVLSGGLGVSAVAAIDHFLSADYDQYRTAFLKAIDPVRKWHDGLAAGFDGRIVLDENSIGHFATVYYPRIDASLGASIAYLRSVVEHTGTFFIPGHRSGFGVDAGLCFRVNLSRDSSRFRGALRRLHRHLAG